METKINTKLIGIFLVTSLMFLVGMVSWNLGQQFFKEYYYYKIIAEESIAGLHKGGSVYYNGINVGYINSIEMGNEDSNVEIVVGINSEVVIKSDTVAKISMKGLTGGLLIDLTGGSVNAPILQGSRDSKSKAVMEIKYQPSILSNIQDIAPVIIDKLIPILESLNQTFSAENSKTFGSIVKSFDEISKESIITLKNINSLTQQLSEYLDKHGSELSSGINQMTVNIASVTSDLKELLRNNMKELQSIINNVSGITNNLKINGLGGLMSAKSTL